MIGVILAAGMGTRLMPLTKEIPKALLEINEMTLLERMIKNCINADIKKFIVVVGYNKEKVMGLCPLIAEKYDIEIKTIVNEKYDVTNTSVSTYLASKFIEENDLDDFILVNGDNVVDPEIISKLAASKIANGKIHSIGKQLDIQSSSGEFIGVSKVLYDDVAEFNRILEGLIEEDPQNYYDFAYKDLSVIKTIDFVLTNGLKWTEIDDHKDWENAKALVKELEG